MAEAEIRPLMPELWDDFADLFGAQGACMGCWCSYWRLPRKDYDAMRGEKAKALMRERVEAAPPPGLLAYRDGRAVGWIQVGPRADTPQWNTPRRLSAPLDDAPAEDQGVWGATCFFVRAGHRRQGVTTALLRPQLRGRRRKARECSRRARWTRLCARTWARCTSARRGPSGAPASPRSRGARRIGR